MEYDLTPADVVTENSAVIIFPLAQYSMADCRMASNSNGSGHPGTDGLTYLANAAGVVLPEVFTIMAITLPSLS